ncbi:MAG TPA: hypothetical protein VFL60_10470 [Gaiellaceae bacterium]|nr:hypothetical protein [Gaiellaceae bacterium]
MVVLAAAALLAAPQTGFAFGRDGGNIVPFRISITVDGKVRATGAAPPHSGKLTKLELATLNRIAYETNFVALPLRVGCRDALPDVATQFIRVGSRTTRVHGGCVARFNRLWAALTKAVR